MVAVSKLTLKLELSFYDERDDSNNGCGEAFRIRSGAATFI
ncbi:hypothetical protein VCR4J2_100095 [Vibrio coralliirubri]|nr:hypothetical protein VCR4J2_100095 [Vibrio coralliirubri]